MRCGNRNVFEDATETEVRREVRSVKNTMRACFIEKKQQLPARPTKLPRLLIVR
jgi:hypothetical protein